MSHGGPAAWLGMALQVVVLMGAVVLHELAHGLVARACGDDTAARAGRLTLNPLRHVDPLGTVLLPGLLLVTAWMAGAQPLVFGWARPVPIDASRMRSPRLDLALVALAGPATNVALAALAAGALALVAGGGGAPSRLVVEGLAAAIVVNSVLGVFNLLPVPPLDGGRVVQAAIPRSLARHVRTVEGVGMVVVAMLVMQTQVVSTLARPVIAFFFSWVR